MEALQSGSEERCLFEWLFTQHGGGARLGRTGARALCRSLGLLRRSILGLKPLQRGDLAPAQGRVGERAKTSEMVPRYHLADDRSFHIAESEPGVAVAGMVQHVFEEPYMVVLVREPLCPEAIFVVMRIMQSTA